MNCTRCNESECTICIECDEPSCGYCECEDIELRVEKTKALELLELFTDSLDELEKVEPIPEDIYNMTATTVAALREYLNQ